MVRERDILSKDVCKRRIPVLALEWGGSVQHFVDQDTQRPPINSASVAASLDHLRRNVLFGSDKGIGAEVGDT